MGAILYVSEAPAVPAFVHPAQPLSGPAPVAEPTARPEPSELVPPRRRGVRAVVDVPARSRGPAE